MKFGPWYCSSLLHPPRSRHRADAVTRSQQVCNVPRLLRCSQDDLPRELAGLSIRDTRRPQLLAKISKWKLDLECCVTDLSSAAAAAPAPAAAVSPAPTAEDPKVLALSQALEALDVGVAADCLDFAKKLTKEGVLTMERLKKLSADKAQKVLEKVQMNDIQIETVMEAIAPAPAPAPAPAMGGLLGSALLQRVGDGNKVQQFAALLRGRLPGRSYRLLYTWSRDGRSSTSFHQRCDNQVCSRAFVRCAAARVTAGAGAHARHRALHHGPHVRWLRERAVEQRR
jgi:hypothetical protein